MFRWVTSFGIALTLALLLVPLSAQADDPPPVCGFYGAITLDGAVVTDGTVIKAWIEGAEVKSSTTINSQYNMYVAGSYNNKVVIFTVGTEQYRAGQSPLWQAGANKKVPLDAFTANVYEGTTPATVGPQIRLSPEQGIATTVTGQGFTPSFEISFSWLGGVLETVPKVVTTDSNGDFSALIVAPTMVAGDYVINASDAMGITSTATFTVVTLKGATGEIGPQGDKGNTGLKGDKGDTGATGEIGPQGEPGEKGDDGSSGSLVIAIIALAVSLLAALIALSNRSKRHYR